MSYIERLLQSNPQQIILENIFVCFNSIDFI